MPETTTNTPGGGWRSPWEDLLTQYEAMRGDVTAAELARLRRIERAARALLRGLSDAGPSVGDNLTIVIRAADLAELDAAVRAALAADEEAER